MGRATNCTRWLRGCIGIALVVCAGACIAYFTFPDRDEALKTGASVTVADGELGPVVITGDAGLLAFPNKTGSGTPGDPFVIENITFDAHGTRDALKIEGARTPLVIRNCTFTGSGGGNAGLSLHKCTGVNVSSCFATGNDGKGICLYDCFYDRLDGNNVSLNRAAGIEIMEGYQHRISGNRVWNNPGSGITIARSSRNIITSNEIRDNGGTGVWIDNAQDNVLVDNTILGNVECDISLVNAYGTAYNENVYGSICVYPSLPLLIGEISVYSLAIVFSMYFVITSYKTMKGSRKVVLLGSGICAAECIALIAIGIDHWGSSGWDAGGVDYLGYVFLFTLCHVTATHLWSRRALFDEGMSVRKLYGQMGFTFLAASLGLVLYIIEYIASSYSPVSLHSLVNTTFGTIIARPFGFMNVAKISAWDVVTTSCLAVGWAFYILPIEQDVKKRRPWFSISMITTVPFCILLLAINASGTLAGNDWFWTISVLAIIVIVIINIVYMFYVYIAMARNVTGIMRRAATLLAVGLVVLFPGAFIGGLRGGTVILESTFDFVAITTIMAGLIFFNLGFVLMSHGAQASGGLNQALLEYYRSQRICIVHRGTLKGRVFLCANCSVMYCEACKAAAAAVENKCWNCGMPLDKAAEVTINLKAGDEAFSDYMALKQRMPARTDLEIISALVKVGMPLLASKDPGQYGTSVLGQDDAIVSEGGGSGTPNDATALRERDKARDDEHKARK